MEKIAVLTSGGDSPGMNAAVRAVMRSCTHFGYKAVGVRFGYRGLIEGDFIDFRDTDASGIIQRGGTILKSARSEKFRTSEGRKKAADQLKNQGIEALITIGGDGTFRGATILGKEHGINVIGIPGTIDNDLIGSDETIGYDTALNTAMEAIDKIRDTADAHERLFLIEVMGRDAGFIALETGIASGAELIILPEKRTDIDEIRQSMKEILKVQRRSTLVIIAEGDESGGALKISEKLEADFKDYEMRVCILGHIQRGGNPTAHDRVLASRLGYEAVKAIYNGLSEVMVGVINNKLRITPLYETFGVKKEINHDLVELYKVLR
ncbi:MAG: 6-phosphofructokinase [Balneolaceae bacterium]|nr:MAG: 6-phosphofructokinase [Balneolaceae bacterium]